MFFRGKTLFGTKVKKKRCQVITTPKAVDASVAVVVAAAEEVAVVEEVTTVVAIWPVPRMKRGERRGNALGPKILYASGRRGRVKTLLGNTKSMVDVTQVVVS